MRGDSTGLVRRRPTLWAIAAGVALLGLAGFFAVWAGDLWAEAGDPYHDSPASTYLVVAITPVLGAAFTAAGAVRLLRLHRLGLLAIAAVLGAIAVMLAVRG